MALDFLHPREKFLILEVLPRGANGLFLSVDEDRNLVFEKFVEHVDLKKLVESPVRRLAEKRWEGKNLFAARRRVIAIADPSIATTIPVPVAWDRAGNREKEKITLIEFEDAIAQEMKRIFNGCRSEAAKRLSVDDLSAILVGSKVEHVAVDGKLVADAVGGAGKKVSFLLELTFTRREIFDSLKEFFSAPEGFFFAESPQVHARMLSGVRSLPVHLIIGDGSLFILQNPAQKTARASARGAGAGVGAGAYPVLYREKLGWDFDTLLDAIAAEFAVSRAVAEGLYHAYAKGKMSETALRHFKKIVDPAAERFFREIELAKISGFVYLDAPFAPPFPLPYKHGRAVFEHPPLEEILQKFDFQVDARAIKLSLSAISRSLAPFLEAYFDKSNSEINQKLRRRLHWLAE